MLASRGLHALCQTCYGISIGILTIKGCFHDHRTEVPVHDQHIRTKPVVGLRQGAWRFGLDNGHCIGGRLPLGCCSYQGRAQRLIERLFMDSC